MKRKFKTVRKLDGIQVGMAIAFNDKGKAETEVLRIFPEGNDVTSPDEPYYVKNAIGSLRYFSRDMFAKSNIDPKPYCSRLFNSIYRAFGFNTNYSD